MGRRKKTAALNQSTPPPVVEEPIAATPEQIEDIKTEGAKMIAEEVNKTIINDLQELKEPAKLLAPELESVVPIEEKPEEIKILEEGAGLVYGEDYEDDPTIERELVDKSIEEKPEKPVVVTDSVANKRMKLRIGSKRR